MGKSSQLFKSVAKQAHLMISLECKFFPNPFQHDKKKLLKGGKNSAGSASTMLHSIFLRLYLAYNGSIDSFKWQLHGLVLRAGCLPEYLFVLFIYVHHESIPVNQKIKDFLSSFIIYKLNINLTREQYGQLWLFSQDIPHYYYNRISQYQL